MCPTPEPAVDPVLGLLIQAARDWADKELTEFEEEVKPQEAVKFNPEYVSDGPVEYVLDVVIDWDQPESESPEEDDEQPDDLLYEAWGVIANAADWGVDEEWTSAAERWRDRFHETLHEEKKESEGPQADKVTPTRWTVEAHGQTLTVTYVAYSDTYEVVNDLVSYARAKTYDEAVELAVGLAEKQAQRSDLRKKIREVENQAYDLKDQKNPG